MQSFMECDDVDCCMLRYLGATTAQALYRFTYVEELSVCTVRFIFRKNYLHLKLGSNQTDTKHIHRFPF